MNITILTLRLAILLLLADPRVQANPTYLATVNSISASVDAIAQQEVATATTTPITISEPTFTAVPQPTQTVPMPQVTKAITFEVDTTSPVVRKIFVYYTENGQTVAGADLTMTADDTGLIRSGDSPDKYKIADNEQLTHGNVGVESKIGAVFTYQPMDSNPHTLTITGNGVTQTLTVPGKE